MKNATQETIKRMNRGFINTKWFFFYFHSFIWDWEIKKYDYQNWYRWSIATPFVDFVVNGWLFWGKKPE